MDRSAAEKQIVRGDSDNEYPALLADARSAAFSAFYIDLLYEHSNRAHTLGIFAVFVLLLPTDLEQI